MYKNTKQVLKHNQKEFSFLKFLAEKIVELEIKKMTLKWRMRDDWMMKTLGHPSSRRKMLITPVWFKNIFSKKILPFNWNF
jgi:hypothetical protein